jgi:anti-sigma B factor antagonist
MGLTIEQSGTGAHPVITVAGEVDLYSSPALRTAILGAIPQAADGVSVDLSAVPYMDSSGVATLVEGLKTARDKGLTFRLIDPSQAVMSVLELARLDTIFSVGPAS